MFETSRDQKIDKTIEKLKGIKQPTGMDLFNKIPKMLAETSMQVTLLPLLFMLIGKNKEGETFKDINPEGYYKAKGDLREFIKTLEKAIPDLQKSLEDMS